MDSKTIWLFIFVGLYWSYCLFWGIKGALTAKTATDYMLAGRGIGLWVFVLAATATSFSGWTVMGHPALIYRDGFQYAYASFYAITIPLTGVLFLKRQWMLGRRYGFVTPGEMLSAYFQSDAIRLLVLLVALVFSIPYLGVQLRASGFLFNVLTDGLLSVEWGMWVLSAVVAAYVASGGLRAVAYVDSMQAVLLAAGIVIIGVTVIAYVPDLRAGLAALARVEDGQAVFGRTTPDGYSQYVAIPGVIQFVGDGTRAVGGAWTGTMILTYMFALMGVQSAPAFSMWAFANRSPAPFARQQVWASACGVGLILILFTAFQGMGGHFLGADLEFMAAHPELVNPVMQEGLVAAANPGMDKAAVREAVAAGVAGLQAGAGPGQLVDLMTSNARQDNLVPQLIYLLGEAMPWLAGLLAVCALAAMQSTGSGYMATAGSMITRDLLRRYLMPQANDRQQKFWGRTMTLLVVLAALGVATTDEQALVLLGGLAVAYGFQMWPALIAVCWWPFLTRQGVVAGLAAGLTAVTLTETIGAQYMPWGRWPLTIHSAGWGILFNLGLAILVSALTQNPADREHRMGFHRFLREHAALPARKRRWVPWAWLAVLAWCYLAIGPGAVLGNWLFGDPARPDQWLFGLPSIWAWQLLFWGFGVLMMWFLAVQLELSTVPAREIDVIDDGIQPPATAVPGLR